MELSLKPATGADLEVIVGFMRAMYRSHSPSLDEAAAKGLLTQLATDPALGRAWVIDADGTAAGYALLTFGFSVEFRGRNAFVDELYVDDPFRGRGVGTGALALIEDEARGFGIKALHLEVTRPNVAAQRLYRRVGYHDHDRYLMTKWLDPASAPAEGSHGH